MEKRILDNWEIENIEDLIPSIEEMFEIKFDKGELVNVSDFHELCYLISNKIDLPNIESCTKQQAFYKLRNVFSKQNLIDRNSLTLEKDLDKLLPRKSRKNLLKKIESEIGFKINLLEAPRFLIKTLFYGLLISLIILFINWQIGLICASTFIFGLIVTSKLGNELRAKTVKDLVELITRENYLKVRSKAGTINRHELRELIVDWFSDKLEMKKEDLLNTRFL